MSEISNTFENHKIPHYAVAGYGRIGKKVTKMLLDNGNRVTVFDHKKDPEEIEEIENNNLRFVKVAGRNEKELLEIGFPNISGLIITTGIFSINTSIFVLTEKLFPREMYNYELVVRAIASEDRDMFVKFQPLDKSKDQYDIVYSEEAGARTVASSILEMSTENIFRGQKIHELKAIVDGDGSDLLINLTRFYYENKLEIFNEFLQNSNLSKNENHSFYYTLISGLKDISPIESLLKSFDNVSYHLAQREMGLTEEIIDEKRTIQQIIKDVPLKGVQ